MDDKVPTVTVRAVPGSRIHVSWGLGNQLHLLGLDSQADSTSTSMQWGTLSAAERGLAYDTLPLYTSLQEAEGSTASAAASFASAVDGLLSSEPPQLGQDDMAETSPDLAMRCEAALWHLIHVYCQGAARGQPATEGLVHWLHSYHDVVLVASGRGEGGASALRASLRRIHGVDVAGGSGNRPEHDAEYWPIFHRLLAMGWIEEAIDLLGLHTIWSHSFQVTRDPAVHALMSLLEPLLHLLRRMPRFSPPLGRVGSGIAYHLEPDFHHHRDGWRKACSNVLLGPATWQEAAAADSATASGVRHAIDILLGHEADVAAATKGWLELLVAQMLHMQPLLRTGSELRALLDRARRVHQGDPSWLVRMLRSLFGALADGDVLAIMQVCSVACGPWFMAHLSTLLECLPGSSTVLYGEVPRDGCDRTEFYTLDYASSLMGTGISWPLAAEYLTWCPLHGRATLQLLLERLPVATDERLADLALATCRRHDLRATAQSIQRVVGVSHWQKGRLGAAFTWLLRAHDEPRLAAVAAPLLASLPAHLAASNGECGKALAKLEGLLAAFLGPGRDPKGSDTLGSEENPKGLDRPRGVPGLLHCVAQLQELNPQQGEKTAAAAREAVLQLATSALSAPDLTLSALFRFIPILEAFPATFTSADLERILQSLESAELQGIAAGKDGVPKPAHLQVQAVRVAVARALAARVVHEGRVAILA